MGIADVREALKDLPGAVTLTMRYEPSTGYQLFMIGEVTARVRPQASTDEIRKAFIEAGLA